MTVFDVCQKNQINFIGHRLLGGINSAIVPRVERRIGPSLSMRSRNIQLFKSCISTEERELDFEAEEIQSLPNCFKGFAVGMQNVDHCVENLEVLNYPNC